LKRNGFRAFYADDATLTADKGWAMMVAGILHAEGFVWGGNTRVDRVDRETVFHFGKNGCRYLFTGLESGVKEVLLGMNKVWTGRMAEMYLESAQKVYGYLAEAGIPSSAFLVFGAVRRKGDCYAPETFGDAKESIRFAVGLKGLSFLSLNFLRFLPGTGFADDPAFACIRPTGEKPLHGGYWDDGYYAMSGESDIRQKWSGKSDVYSCFELEDEMPVSTLVNPEYATELVRFAIRQINMENARRGKNESRLQLSSAGERGKRFIEELEGKA
jgi:anaerobic magnesium-protoporphyrin IX monomethyl ester cyclase